MWDGNPAQVNAIFKQGTGTTYPLLLDGSPVSREYKIARDNYVVIDHEGVIRYRTPGGARLGTGFDDAAIRRAIAVSLEDLALASEAEAEAAAQAAAAEMTVEDMDVTAVLGEEAVPGTFGLFGNFPNPFNAGTTIRFQLAQTEVVSLGIYDVQGQLVRLLWSGSLAAGESELSWDGRDDAGRQVASGIYLVRLTAASRAQMHKMLLLR